MRAGPWKRPHGVWAREAVVGVAATVALDWAAVELVATMSSYQRRYWVAPGRCSAP